MDLFNHVSEQMVQLGESLKESVPREVRYFLGAGAAVVGIYYYRKYIQGGQFRKDHVKMDGKVVIITGGNTGIGKETAMDLARRNAKIYLACRDRDRCEAARQEIIEKTGNTKIYNRHLDLTTLKSVREFAEDFVKEEEKLDVLINNAGVLYVPHSITEDGCEITMQINHLSHFLLSHLLLEPLKKALQGRIVNVSSLGYRNAKIDKNDLHFENSSPTGLIRYANSKLAIILTVQRLAKELKGTNVTVNSLHPGYIQTTITPRNTGVSKIARCIIKIIHPLLMTFFGKTRKSGAQTTIRCAVDPELSTVSGKYFIDCEEVQDQKMAFQAKDGEISEFIWRESLRLAKIPSDFIYSK
ncbi:retinol dehydrogenase 11-like [Phlebotomus argentipes]|uniref:retinol dehydrogenase 11-like n=1 Tax=Phlebotomus argentipes TaxID=94469 RepID=UPI0028937A1E|nr:retinol dehydrogenase 11-like [Phlebotomus argentipes]